jgi:hypothetical protein
VSSSQRLLDLIVAAASEAGAIRAGLALVTGGAVFSGANFWLAKHAAKHRKRCGECVQQAWRSLANQTLYFWALGYGSTRGDLARRAGSRTCRCRSTRNGKGLQCLAAGLIAMVVETMVPEATHDSSPFSGRIAVLGFLVVLALLGRWNARGNAARDNHAASHEARKPRHLSQTIGRYSLAAACLINYDQRRPASVQS